MRGSAVLLVLLSCGGDDSVVPPDRVRVTIFEEGEPASVVPVWFTDADGLDQTDTETDLDGVAEGRVGDAGTVTIFLRNGYTSIHEVEPGTSLEYALGFDSSVKPRVSLNLPGGFPGARGNGYRWTDGCGQSRSFTPNESTRPEIEWRCMSDGSDPGRLDVLAWAEGEDRDVAAVATNLGIDVPILGTQTTPQFTNWTSTLDRVEASWFGMPEGQDFSVTTHAVRDGRRHRAARRNARDAEGSLTLGAGPAGFSNAVDVTFGGFADGHGFARVARRRPGNATVSVDLSDLVPAARGRLDVASRTIVLERLQIPATAVAIEVRFSVTDEDGSTLPWRAFGPPDIGEFVIPELEDLELTIETDSLTVSVIAASSLDTDGFLGGYLFVDELQGLRPLDEARPSEWTWWQWSGPAEPPTKP